MPASVRPDIAFDGRAILGEGPVWDDEQQRLVWLDILPGLVHRFDPATGTDEVFRAGKPVGSAGLRYGGGLVLAVADGFALLDPGLAVTRLLDGVTISNGLAWTADGATLYYIDSPTQGVDAFDYDTGTGRLENRRRVVDIPAAAGLPDGMTIDTDGCLWVALYGGSAVHRYTPDGRLDAVLSFPVSNVTCPVFGGPGLGMLYVTSARDGLGERQLAAQPHAGAVFAADAGARGLPALRFAG